MKILKIGVIRYGYWGPNIVRNLTAIKETKVEVVCDQNADALKRAAEHYPHIKTTKNSGDVFNDATIDCVAIVTPVTTHFPLAKKALEHGKHVFVEKPFTKTSKEAQILIELAKKKKLIIMVDHTFIFTGAVQKIKELVDSQALGDLMYYDSTRVSLGLFQHDVNVIWDLAPHDFAIIDFVIKNKPVALSAQGVDHFNRGQENLAYITVYFENNLLVHINVNWLSPVKVRTTLIGGSKKMLVWNDLEQDEKIKIYDKGVNVENKDGLYRLMIDYRSGDMWSPRVDYTEALKRELVYFVECVTKKKQPINDGNCGLRVVRMLELADESLKNNGKLVKFK